MTWQRYPRPLYTRPGELDADIRAGTMARKTRAHAEAVAAWWDQPRPPLGRHSPAFPRTLRKVAA